LSEVEQEALLQLQKRMKKKKRKRMLIFELMQKLSQKELKERERE